MVVEALAAFSRMSPHFRGKIRVLNALVPQKGIKNAKIFGLPMALDLSDYIQRLVFLGYYERRETALIRELLRPGSVFVDVGANIGYFTALAADIVGTTGLVLSFEPSPYAYERLSRMVARCGSNIRVFEIGLSDNEGQLRLFVPPETSGNHDPSVVEYCPGMRAISVPVKKLAAVLSNLSVQRVDLMKVDAEAHEPEVFLGCEPFLRRGDIQNILCEFNDPLLRKRGSSSCELLTYLRGLGYQTNDESVLDGRIVNLLLRFAR